jgi:hypothetical protein
LGIGLPTGCVGPILSTLTNGSSFCFASATTLLPAEACEPDEVALEFESPLDPQAATDAASAAAIQHPINPRPTLVLLSISLLLFEGR